MITWSTPVVEEEKRPVPCILCGGLIFKARLSCDGFSYVRCVRCDLVQVNPQPLEAEVKKRYDSAYGQDYFAYELANEENFLNLQLLALNDAGFYELETELSVRQGQNKQKLKVLDIGSATGALLAWLKGRDWDCSGIEISGPQAEYARQKKNLDIRGVPLKEAQFPAQSFDLVLASHLIEHLNDPAALIREAHRILASSGRLLVTTPNIAGFQARLFRKRWRSAIFDHLYLFSQKTLSRLLRENGFVIEKTATWGGLAVGAAAAMGPAGPPLKRLLDRAAKRFGFGDVMIMRARKSTEES